MVPEYDRLGGEDGFPDDLCDLLHLGFQELKHLTFHHERKIIRLGTHLEGLLDPLFHGLALISGKN